MAGLFDVDKELARLGKPRAQIEKDLAGVVARLTNPKFLEKASQVCVGRGRVFAGMCGAGWGLRCL